MKRRPYSLCCVLLLATVTAACQGGVEAPTQTTESPKLQNRASSTSTKSNGSSEFLKSVAGVYKNRFEARRGDSKLQAEHILEVVPVDDRSAYVRLEIQDFWVGRIWGIATYDKNSLIYDNHQIGDERCVIQYLWSASEVTTMVDYERTPGCRAYHGATGGFVGETFDKKERQDIRYMQRLKDSKEFKEAMAEYGSANSISDGSH